MIQRKEQEKKKTLLSRLPRFSRVVWIMLLLGVFLIMAVPMAMIYQQQPLKQAELEHELSLLQKISGASMTQGDQLRLQLKIAEKQVEIAKGSFPRLDQGLEIIRGLLELAEANGIDVRGTETILSDKNKDPTDYSVVTYVIHASGQVPEFQNFLLVLNREFPTCQVKEVLFGITNEEGKEDKAVLTIDITLYKGG